MNDDLLIRFRLYDFTFTADNDPSLSCRKSFLDTFNSLYDTTRRKIRSLYKFHQFIQ